MKTLKIWWKDPRGHALLEIGLYGIFFGVILILLNIKTPSKKSNTIEEQYQKLEFYRYTMVIQNENETYHLNGNQNPNPTFIVEEQNQEYHILDGKIFDENGTMISTFDWNLFSPKKLSSFMQKGTINSTTNYKDGSQKREYEMDCSLWNPSLEGMCRLETIQKEKQIVQVILWVEKLYSIDIHYHTDLES